ncbi:MAG: glycosyltransferase [Fervidobacterium sp.]|uniref:Glycosyl transferase family 1 n=1 Tax=Fervidobacterium pennivorans TaxID=93466 RepID=A0A172T3U2_FERPE|nr:MULTISPECIES: glycosyltransferase [Fervidobacterium]ANE41641.1 glycosyl transferase family 1 [Fervidobacterium pennivorans]NPU89429.1 glycosyltransferase [Fervidobacterium sp.]
MSDFPELSQLTELITQGRFSEAKQIVEKLPDIVQKENAFGMIYYYEGKLDDAIEHFKKAVEIDPINSDVLFNYGKALFDKKDYKEAWRYLLRIHNKDWAVYDLLGDTQIVQGNIPMALYYYRKAAEILPLEEMKKKYLEYKKQYHQDVNIAILCLPGLDNFIRDIADILGEVYNVKLVVSANGNKIVQAYEWADIVWLEWANELAVEVTNKLEKKGKKIICRLHSYEALTNAFLSKIFWDKVDAIVLVAEHMKDVIRMYHPDVYKRIEAKIKVIHNGLNLERFKYKPRTRGYNIAVVAHINYKKDPTMWLQIMGLLKKIDPRYNLSIAGDFQDYRYHLYFHYFIEEAGLRDNVKLLGHVNNIEEFLEDKNYVLSTSVHESFGYNIAEAMAVGIKPVVHNFYGAKTLWMEDTLFNFIEEIPQILEFDYRSEVYRTFVEENYSFEKQIRQIEDVLLKV